MLFHKSFLILTKPHDINQFTYLKSMSSRGMNYAYYCGIVCKNIIVIYTYYNYIIIIVFIIIYIIMIIIILFVGHHLATKLFIGKLPANRGVWVIIA